MSGITEVLPNHKYGNCGLDILHSMIDVYEGLIHNSI